jgi:hypothetical protein
MGSPIYTREIRLCNFASLVFECWFHESLKPDNQSTLTFSSHIRISPIVILALMMSRNLSYRLLNPNTLKLRCTHEFDFSTPVISVGISDFAVSQILMQMFRDFSPRNTEMVCHLSTSLTLVAPHCSLSRRDIAFHNFVIPVAMFTRLPPTKPRCKYPRVNLMVLVTRIYGTTPPEL